MTIRGGFRWSFAAATVAVSFYPAAAQVRLVDVTQQSGLDFFCGRGPTFEGMTSYDMLMQHNQGGGIAIGDYDNDGDLDVYVCAQAGTRSRLFRSNVSAGSKTFTDVTDTARVGDFGWCRAPVFADLNNDGNLDLLLLKDDDGTDISGPSRIFRNNGNGAFTDVTAASGFNAFGYLRCGAALADYDRDGLLDIYITNWPQAASGRPDYPGANLLYRNLGNFTFRDVTTEVGLARLTVDSFAPIFANFDTDGFPDIYVAVDRLADVFYRNAGGTFTDITVAANLTHTGNDMGVACADYDDDGDLDMYVTNITDPTNILFILQNNVLHVNQLSQTGQLRFQDEAVARGVEDAYWSWGAEFFDVENDGDLDLVVATGYDEIVLEWLGSDHPLYRTPNVLFINDGTGHFTRDAGAGLEVPMDSRTVLAFDYDRDGDQDLIFGNIADPLLLFENTSSPPAHWLDVRLLEAPGGNRDGVGASVYATLGAVTKRRDVLCGVSYLGGNPPEVHFGLGDRMSVDQLRIKWTSGAESHFENVAGDRFITISNTPGDCYPDGRLNNRDIAGFVSVLLGQPGAPVCLSDLNGDGHSDGADIASFLTAIVVP